MFDKSYLNSAHQALAESYRANERGEHLRSWGHTVPARVYYLADAAANAAAIPLYALGAAYGGAEAVFTWGKKTWVLTENLKGIDNSLSRVVFGTVGAVLSPSAAKATEIDSAVELVATLALVTAVAGTPLFIASKLRLPNMAFYNHHTGFTWGWY